MLRLGIDLGGTNIAVGAVNNQGIIVEKNLHQLMQIEKQK